MQITKQLAIFLDDEPGTLARVCHALADAKVNIYAISASDTVDHTVIRLVVDNPRKALLVFEEHGTLVVEDDVLMIDGDNRPGSLARICERLGAAKVNIEYCYCATSPGSRRGLLILRVKNPQKALKVLNS
jgi:hypothetical protein